MPPYIWMHPYIWMPPYVWTPSCMYGCSQYVWVPPMFGCFYVWMPPYVWTPLCMFGCPQYVSVPLIFGYSLYVWMMFGCPMYIHNTKKACFVTLRECPYTPLHLDAPICLDGPCMFECCHMFASPLYVWMPLVCLGAPYVWMLPLCLDIPICLDAPHMFGHLPVCLDDVWMPHVHTQHKESMLCHTKGVSICPHTFGCPHMFGCILCMFGWPCVCLNAPMFGHPLCLDAPYMFGCFNMFGHPNMFGCPPYVYHCWQHFLAWFVCPLYD